MIVETELAAPAFLIAMPQLGDPSFNRGVVLLIDHNDQGTMGLVINRPTEIKIAELCAGQNMTWGGDQAASVYQGGPVQPERAFILHASAHQGPETEEVLSGVRFSYSLETLALLSKEPPDRYRIFLGYAGWGPGQLATELTSGAWLVGQVSETLLFSGDSDGVWEAALREMGIDPMQLMHSGAVH
jgi:putative transcriptional regulator